VNLVTSSVPSKKILHWANACFSVHAISQPCRHNQWNTSKGLCDVYTISNLDCCKCTRMRFHCANALLLLRSCAPYREHWSQAVMKFICFKQNTQTKKIYSFQTKKNTDEIYLFQTKYSFEIFRNSEAIKENNSILYSYVALSIKGTRFPSSNWFIYKFDCLPVLVIAIE